MKLFSAVCKYPADEVRKSQQGREYISALFHDESGVQHRVFGPPGYEPLRQLQAGQKVQLCEDSKGRLHLVEPDPQPTGDRPAGFMGFQPSTPVVQQQQPATYSPQPQPSAPGSSPADDPVLVAAQAWAKAYHFLVASGVPPEAAVPAASTSVIQGMGRR